MNKKILLGLLTVVVALGIFYLSRFAWVLLRNQPEFTYATYAEAQKDGMIEKGWIPAFVPETATNLHLAINLDTNNSLLSFEAPEKALDDVADCAAVSQKGSHALNARWWSDEYYNDSATRFYRCGKEKWLAVNKNKVWYWVGMKHLTVEELVRHAKSYTYLDKMDVILSGYVDLSNVFDIRTHDESNTFGLVPDFRKGGENDVFVIFDNTDDAYAVLDQIHNETPSCTSTDIAIRMEMEGMLRKFEMPMNFNTDIGYQIQVHDYQDIVFLSKMGDPLPSSKAEFRTRIRLLLPDGNKLKLPSKAWQLMQAGFTVSPVVESFAQLWRVRAEKVSAGDLNGDGREDAAALIRVRNDGEAPLLYLVAAVAENEFTLPEDATYIGKNLKVKGLEIHDGTIELHYSMAPAGKADSSDSAGNVVRVFKLVDNRLVEDSKP